MDIKDINPIKSARRKTWAFYCIQLICAIAAYKTGIAWPLVVLSGGVYLVFVGAISTEKILLAWINKKG
jgi:hypothetical protein